MRTSEAGSGWWCRGAVALLAVMGVLTLAACGGSDSDKQESASTTTSTTSTAGSGTDPFSGLDGTVTWYETSGAAATDARKDIVLPAFTERTGVTTRQDYNADATKLLAAMQAGGKVPWDVIEFPGVGPFLEARDKGYLAKLDPNIIPLDRLDPGSYDEYGILGERYGINIVWNTDVWPEDGKHPTSLKDIYDTKTFPGKRCLFKYPAFGGVLESALLADGVPRDELYPLDTKRAFAKLDTIKDDVVWYERDAPKLLTSGECDLAISWSGTIRDAVEQADAPLAISWDDALYTEAAFGIPKDTPNMAAAQAMLAFFLFDDDIQKKFVEASAYPTAIKGQDFSEQMIPWLPLGDNLATARSEDHEYYKKNLTSLSDEFFGWAGS